ncbi:MAG: PAS domain S-box protein [Aphanothece sp. CMT-3BRIN-NPC111]|nr:PAS domain S-box protein [Aphanothece sp. CMT-3BRIN-NPC111]
MLRVKRSQILRYGVAVFTVAIALILKLLLKPWIGLEETPFLTFFVSIAIAAWYGGIGPGVMATVMSAWVCDYFFLIPHYVFSLQTVGQGVQIGLFVLEGLFISVLVTSLQSAKRRAELNKLEIQHHQESLRQTEEGFRLLVEGVKDYAIYRLDPHGYIVSWNEGAERIKGYRAEEIIGRHISYCYPEEDIQRGKPEQNLKVAAEVGRFEGEGWRIRKDGSRFWATMVITALRDEAQNLKGFANVLHDITERKRAEEERNQLLAREQAARALAEAATDMFQRLQAITDITSGYGTSSTNAPLCVDDLLHELLSRISEILQTDTAAIMMMDATSNTFVVRAAKGLEEKIKREVRIPIGEGLIGRVALERQPTIVEQDAHTKYNPVLRELGIQSLIGVPLLVGDEAIGAIHVGTLCSRQFTQDDVQLLQQVAQRAALAIDRARMYEAERNALVQAQEANRVKDEFLAIVSHELRTPIQSILGWAQMLRSRKLNEATLNKALETVERNAKQQVKLIDDILDISRIISGNTRLHMIQLHPVSIMEAAIIAASSAAEAKDIQIESVLDRSVGFICADPDRLQQMVGNLLSNAIKFTPSGGKVILRLERIENSSAENSSRQETPVPNSYAQIVVSDTGEGISPEFLPHVFEDFRQGNGSLTRTHGGLGLGLTIVRYVVELHGGTVEAASEGEGKGATFTVQLPIVSTGEKKTSCNIDPSPVSLQLNGKTAPQDVFQ